VTGPLDKLHDFYQPAPPSWMPQTIGWYVVFGLIGLFLLWMLIHYLRRWFANRYRRESLRELALLPPEQFSSLLKRTALTAWPREKVAALNGEAWINFLNTTVSGGLFDRSPGNRVEEAALRPITFSGDEEQELRKLTSDWIRRHRV
jgi:Domain of unknown function (DUF4381)